MCAGGQKINIGFSRADVFYTAHPYKAQFQVVFGLINSLQAFVFRVFVIKVR